VKTGPDRPVQLVGPGTGPASSSSRPQYWAAHEPVKISSSATEPTLKLYLIFLIEIFLKNPQIKLDQSHTTKNHIK
jgi:hypothetical protein